MLSVEFLEGTDADDPPGRAGGEERDRRFEEPVEIEGVKRARAGRRSREREVLIEHFTNLGLLGSSTAITNSSISPGVRGANRAVRHDSEVGRAPALVALDETCREQHLHVVRDRWLREPERFGEGGRRRPPAWAATG